jgi:hypothetical protein
MVVLLTTDRISFYLRHKKLRKCVKSIVVVEIGKSDP